MRPPSDCKEYARLMHNLDDTSYLEVLSAITQESTVHEPMVEYFANEALEGSEIDDDDEDDDEPRPRYTSAASTASEIVFGGSSPVSRALKLFQPDPFQEPDDFVPYLALPSMSLVTSTNSFDGTALEKSVSMLIRWDSLLISV